MKTVGEWCVLAVDDEPDNLNIVVELLDFHGARVLQADGGQAALALLNETRPDMILLDLFMPGVDGWAVQRQLRANPEFEGIPIVALTALVMPDDVQQVSAAGFEGYIAKPFRVAALLTELQRIYTEFHENRRQNAP